MPLRMILPGQIERIHSTSFQLSDGSNCCETRVAVELRSLRALQVADDVAEVAPLGARDAHQPARLRGEVDDVLQPHQVRRHRQAVLDVHVALAEDLQVDGEHQRAALGGDRPLDQRFAEAAVLHHVELKPERLLDIGGDVLDRADRHGGERVGNAGGLRGAAGEDFAVADLHAGGADRRQDQRHARRLAEDRRLLVAHRDVDENALAEFQRLEVGAVGAQRLLGIGAVIDIVEERLRHLAPVQFAQILDAGDVFHVRSLPVTSAFAEPVACPFLPAKSAEGRYSAAVQVMERARCTAVISANRRRSAMSKFNPAPKDVHADKSASRRRRRRSTSRWTRAGGHLSGSDPVNVTQPAPSKHDKDIKRKERPASAGMPKRRDRTTGRPQRTWRRWTRAARDVSAPIRSASSARAVEARQAADGNRAPDTLASVNHLIFLKNIGGSARRR